MEHVEKILRDWCGRLSPALREAAEYALFPGGHRIRPRLCLAWYERAGGNRELAARNAAAVELVHTVSLIQDDLPCMDNAKERRGRASVWKRFGERTAVLVSDAMLAGAFNLVSGQLGASVILADAVRRMAQGQEDEALGGGWREVNDGKTAALFEVACELGTLCGSGGNLTTQHNAGVFGQTLGRAYQLLDDARDGDGATAELGRDEAERMGQALMAKLRDIDPEIADMVTEAMT